MSKDTIIGIDFGTTTSCVAVVEDGVPKVIPNAAGQRTIPSIVTGTEDGRWLIGDEAKRQLVIKPEGTVRAVKRILGRKWDSKTVVVALKMCAHRLVRGPNRDIRIVVKDAIYSAVEVSAAVLGQMKRIAEDDLGREVTGCVIAVPTFFNARQRSAIEEAGRMAGLNVVRMITEPTAAALAYGYRKGERKVAVFSLGGGTFDASVLEMQNEQFEVIATAGDLYLGGEDFDHRIIEWLRLEILKAHDVDVMQDRQAMQCLRDAAEAAKHDLSSKQQTDIYLALNTAVRDGHALHFKRTLTRRQFEALVIDLNQRCIDICNRMLMEASIRRQEIDDVILVGGQTRMPKIQEMVRDFFGTTPSSSINAEEVAAIGAAIQAAAIRDDDRRVVLLDVTPDDLHVMMVGGEAQLLVAKDTVVPVTASCVFKTVRADQTTARLIFFSGDAESVDDNKLLLALSVSGIRKAPPGEAEFEVTISISADGTVEFKPTCRHTGRQLDWTEEAVSKESEDEISRASDHQPADGSRSETPDSASVRRSRRRGGIERQPVARIQSLMHRLLAVLGFAGEKMEVQAALSEQELSAFLGDTEKLLDRYEDRAKRKRS